jgi:hypothetical protein
MSSLQDTEKYIAAKHQVNSEKLSPVIKKNLKTGVALDQLVLSKDNWASESFKLAEAKAHKVEVSNAVRGGCRKRNNQIRPKLRKWLV